MSPENLKTFLHLLSHLILMIILAATVRTPQHARLLLTHRHQGSPFFSFPFTPVTKTHL